MSARLPGTLHTSADPKWQDAGAGGHYAGGRWRSQRAAQRDPMLVERILDRHGVRPSWRPILDAPCGTGRLHAVLERRGMRTIGVDNSSSMLAEAQRAARAALCQASVARLPFKDESFDAVVCCRLLHHLRDEEELEQVVRELVRVSYRLVIASFWDSASLHAWRRRVGLRRPEGAHGRHAVSKRTLRNMFDAAGAEVVGFHHSFRFVSQQAFVVAQRRAPADDRARTPLVDLRSRLLDLNAEPASGSFGGA